MSVCLSAIALSARGCAVIEGQRLCRVGHVWCRLLLEKFKSYRISRGLFVLSAKKLWAYLNTFSTGKKVELYLQKVKAELWHFSFGKAHLVEHI